MRKHAIASVTDKTGLAKLAACLHQHGINIISSTGTAKEILKAGIPVQEVSAFTGSPEIFEGRLKTLHPRVEGGILYVRDNPVHVEEACQNRIEPIDFVVVNLYEFARAAATPGLSLADVIEKIDIGGPTMLRAAVKNWITVTVLCDPADYDMIIDEMDDNQGVVSEATRFYLAQKVFRVMRQYETDISVYLDQQPGFGVDKGDDGLPIEAV